jgi:hypothetical protein
MRPQLKMSEQGPHFGTMVPQRMFSGLRWASVGFGQSAERGVERHWPGIPGPASTHPSREDPPARRVPAPLVLSVMALERTPRLGARAASSASQQRER